MKNALKSIGFLLAAGLWPTAQADITGVYRMTDDAQKDSGTLTIQMRDEQHIRYDFKGKKPEETGSLLLLQDKFYAITPQGEVMDMDLLTGLARSFAREQAKPDKQTTFRLDATGKKETIAGITGEVYRWKNAQGIGDAVLTKDQRVKWLSTSMERVGEYMEKNMGGTQASASFRDIRDNPLMKDHGVLQSSDASGSHIRLESISEQKLGDKLFVLPKKTNIPALPGLPAGIPNMNDPQIQMLMQEMLKQQAR